jgi:clathrin heavy chain
MDTAAQSRDVKLVDDLLAFFVGEGEKECFAACLFTCYDMIRPDHVLELAWRHGLVEFAMPYVIQFGGEYTKRLEALEKKLTDQDAEAAQQEMETPMAMMDAPMALPQYAQQGAMGYQDPNMMQQQQFQQQQGGYMQQPGMMQQPGGFMQ